MKKLTFRLSIQTLFLALMAFLISCSTTPTGRRQVRLLDNKEVAVMGQKSFEEIKKSKPASQDKEKIRIVQCVSNILLQRNGLNPAKWEVVVFKDPAVNAFAVPGNKIGVFEGLFKTAQNQHQLAAVIGHEIGHVQAHHANERISHELLIQGGLALASIAINSKSTEGRMILQGLGVGAVFGVALPFSRKHELEADAIGLQLMAKAGFSPGEAVTLWNNMAALNKGGRTPEFLSTHPEPETRAKRIRSQLPKLEVLAEGAVEKFGSPKCE